MSKNTVLKALSTELQIPFEQILSKDFLPALDELEKTFYQDLEQLKTAPASFDNTILGIENAFADTVFLGHIFFPLFITSYSEELSKIAEKISEKSVELTNAVFMNEDIFKKVETIYKDLSSLDSESQRLVKEYYENFLDNGVQLDSEKKQKLAEALKKRSQSYLKFGKNGMNSHNAFSLVIENENEIDGVPENLKTQAKALAEKKKLSGWVFNLDEHMCSGILKNCKNRETRKKIYTARQQVAFGGKFDNQPVIKDTLSYSYEIANLLGFKNFSEKTLKRKMAKTPETVTSFLKELKSSCLEKAKKEFKDVETLAKADGLSDFRPWDWSFYLEKLQTKTLDFDFEKLKPYFSLNNVLSGAFLCAEKLYNLTFKEANHYPKYHKEIKTYEVYKLNQKEPLAVIHFDFFPREGKNKGAWLATFGQQGQYKGCVQKPILQLACNFPPSTEDQPSLLSLQEARTLFHEFGHALHALLSNCKYQTLSGTSVARDFVELPSQLMENWLYFPETLQLFAKHYKTNEPLPEEWVEKIKEGRQFAAASFCLRQLNFAILDMAFYTTNPKNISNIQEFEKQHITDFFEKDEQTPSTCFSCSFGHIFSGGYSSGYYSYKWSEMLSADAFEKFLQNGLFHPQTAKEFEEHVLSRGNSDDPMTLYKKFRGQDPSINALLKQDGLTR